MIDAATYSISNTYKYDAYGNQEVISDTDTNPFRYSGEYYDYETGFIYLRARYYDPSIGRFLSEDIHWNVDNMIFGDKEYKDGETKFPDITAIMQSNNLYAYGIGNPVMFVDPSGEVVDWVIIALVTYAQAVLTSPDLQFDMQMLVHDIGEGDYVSAAFGLVDILAPGFSGSKSVPKIIRKYFDDTIKLAKNLAKGTDKLPKGWTKTVNNGYTHIKDTLGRIRIRIDPPDKVTKYEHMHIYDANGNSLDMYGNIVDKTDPAAHIPLKEVYK